MTRQVLRALSLAIVLALGVTLVPLASAATTGTAKRTVAAESAPKLLKDIRRSCKSSKSAERLKTRTRKRIRSNTYRYTYVFCSGRRVVKEVTTRRGRTIIKTKVVRVGFPQPGPVVTTPGPVVTTPGPPVEVPRPASKRFRMTLLQNNDGESKYLVGNSVNNYGGVTRFKTILDGLRAQADAYSDPLIAAGVKRKGTVVISSGDNTLPGLNLKASFEKFDRDGSPFYDSIAFSQLGYDAASIGNHEYDFGPERLAQFIAGDNAATTFVSANSDYSGEPSLQALVDQGRIRKSTVVVKGGERIGIVGVTPPETSNISKPGSVRFNTAIADVVNAEADKLTEDGVNKIIFASHLQNSANERAVTAQLRNVDIVIAGGGDDLLAGPDDKLVPTTGDPRTTKPTTARPTPPSPFPTPVGPYPTVIKDADGSDVPLVTTQGEYRYVGRLTAEFDANGRLTSVDDPLSGPVRVSNYGGGPETATLNAAPADPDRAAEDAGLKSSVTDPLTSYQAVLAANVIGSTEVQLQGGNPDPIRIKEANLGNLVADAFRYLTNKNASAEGRPLSQVAFSNGGGIRTSIAGPASVSEKQTFDVLPFDNYMVTVPDVSRQTFKELMEHGVGALNIDGSDPTLSANGKFPQVSGFRMVVDVTRTAQASTATAVTTPGQRIRSLTLDDGTPVVVNGVVVPGPPVAIATTNFTAAGGDNYPFRGAPFQIAGGDQFIPYQQTLFRFIADPVADGGLGGTITTADYPVGGEGRTTISRTPVADTP